ncbi:hypothetical protein [Microbispora sp. NPDC049633]|uniref:hypothetical protein n=1 Tax=Microbispora sp. NPDC049633 TaxID=3154355 RepID=UPI0034305547
MNTETAGPKVRLVVCRTCKSVEEIPDFQGPIEYDDLLDVVASRHEYALNHPHPGLNMFNVEEKHWRIPDKRVQILDRIKEQVGDGLGDEFYEVKATFKDDAFSCWKKHNKTTNCDDFRSDAKRLIPNTAAERKEAGLPKPTSNRFLCDFCPVNSVAMQRMRAKRGDYHYTG